MKQSLTPSSQTTTCAAEAEEMVLFGIRACEDQYANNLSPMRSSRNQAVSPISLRR